MSPNDNDEEKFGEESEYHFSDDEEPVSYGDDHIDEKPIETTATVPPAPADSKKGSKRIAIGVAVVALVVVMYKFVTPSTPVVSTDISTQPAVAQNSPLQANVPVQAVTPAPQVAQVSPAPQAAQQLPPTTNVATSTPNALPGAPLPSEVGPAPANDLASLPAPAAPMGAPLPSADQYASGAIQTPDTSGVIPMAVASQQPGPANAAINALVATPQVSPNPDAQVAALEQQSAQLMAQLQASYSQKINDFDAQNKMLQTQVQTLNSRVVELEADLNKMMQMMTQQTQRAPQQPTQTTPAQQQTAELSDGMAQALNQPVDAKSNYNVQAIIPGRAWLRSNNGETVTVAEGDVVRDLGRITKIDPYDGIVEINTGSKVVSLSYGNVG